ASKAAINALTRVVARENASVGVRANVIAPGLVETDIATGMLEVHGERLHGIVPLGRIGQPKDVGELAVYLASDDAAWVTGKIFRIDGGQF
nr:SDR family oxidoreductase [Actinomycetota bacterium]NIU18081.1 SDR family oxidoreductase [Actinomycetota bacterium]NIW26512.1 SDR family oxidoreductase [Actinomycetota bacterium]NIX19080.1 SDR family oxidoreductase [Actinomycetota bacterium]NIX49451.1 SDR family oxidoreductase [Actinomycetota bacterium]